MHLRNIVVAVVAAFPAVVAFGGGAKWTNNVANTPDTAYLWSDSSNWQDGMVGGEGDSITNAPSAIIYVRKDTSSAPARISRNLRSMCVPPFVSQPTQMRLQKQFNRMEMITSSILPHFLQTNTCNG